MNNNSEYGNGNKQKNFKSTSHLFRYFLIISMTASMLIIVMVGLGLRTVRELQMIELKKEVDVLLHEFGKEEKYKSDYEKIVSEPLS